MEPGDRDNLTGDDLEFLITPSDIQIKEEDFSKVMTPSSMPWEIVKKDGWDYYKVDDYEFSYSWEEPGIQMIFSSNTPYAVAKLIVDEVVFKLLSYTGMDIEAIFIRNDKPISF
jgi:hypothetical protein